MRKLFLILFFLMFSVAFSQTKSGVVTYNLSFADDELLQNNNVLKEYYNQAINGSKYITYSLFFNENESLFQINDALGGADSDLSFTKAFASDNSIYNSKTSDEAIIQIDGDLGTFLLSKNSVSNWTLLNETKTINGYLCFKATTTYTVVNSVRTFQHPVIAWYCPSINVNFGPKGYKGLPGLIISLQERSTVFGLTSIIFDKEPRVISKPNKGKVVTEEELRKKLSERFRN